MVTTRDPQSDVVAFLADPATHGAPVERVETHISMVFLAGANAYKLKRAVAFDYLDFSTPDLRRRYCEEEVRLNRRTAPALYKGVLPITRADNGALALNGAGPAIDWVVHMGRFDQAQLLDRLAQAGALPLALMDPLGRSIAAFHRAAAPRPEHGGARGMQFVIDGNASGFALFGGGLDGDAVKALIAESRAELVRRRDLLERRRASGAVRACHGDLHLGNIVLIDNVPTLFDAIEFNEEIASDDVLYDVAFLLMDLRHRGLVSHANAAWNAYLEETRDYGGLALMPLFLSCRAAVRAKVNATLRRVSQAGDYIDEAVQLLEQGAPLAVAIGGLSGTGKSTLAAQLAPWLGAPPGAVVLRSDVIRKQLCGAGRLDRLDASSYSPAMSVRVYAELADRARRILAAGHSVIVDAVLQREADRAALEEAASAAGVRLQGFWLEVPDRIAIERLRARRQDPSDADEGVLAMQRQADTGVISWDRLNADNPNLLRIILPRIRAVTLDRSGAEDSTCASRTP